MIFSALFFFCFCTRVRGLVVWCVVVFPLCEGVNADWWFCYGEPRVFLLPASSTAPLFVSAYLLFRNGIVVTFPCFVCRGRRERNVTSLSPPHTSPTQQQQVRRRQDVLIHREHGTFTSTAVSFYPLCFCSALRVSVLSVVTAVQGQIHGHAGGGEHSLRRGAAATTACHCLGLGNPPGAFCCPVAAYSTAEEMAACV